MTSTCFPARLRRLTLMALGLLLFLSFTGFGIGPARAQSAATERQAASTKHQTTLSETDAYRLSPSVVKFGAALGMEPETAANAFTILNLVIFWGAVAFGLFKIVPKAFRNRNTAIQKHLVDARTATEEATARLSSVEERLSRLDAQIADMRKQAEADSVRDEQRLKASVEDEKVKIVAAAEAEILSATTLARRDLQKYAAELAIEHAARNLVITPETDRLLVESFARKLAEGSSN